MFCFSRANHASTDLKMFLSWKLDTFALFTNFLVGWNLENLQKHAVSIFFRLSWHFKWEKPVLLESIFIAKQELITRTSFAYKTSWLVRISLLIIALNKELRVFSRESLFYKSNRKLFSGICIGWYKHSSGWENSRQLCKPSGLHSCLELSQPFSCLYQAMQTRETFLLLK